MYALGIPLLARGGTAAACPLLPAYPTRQGALCLSRQQCAAFARRGLSSPRLVETAAASNYSGKEAGPPPEAPAAQAAPRGSLGSLGSYAAALVSVLGVAGAAGVVCQVGQAAGWPFAGVAAVLVPTLLVCFRWLTAETMHVTDSAYDEAVDVHCRGSTPADVMHKYEEEAAACRERCMRLFFSCCVPAAFLWLLADAVCAAAFMYGVPLPSLWSLINAKAGVIQAALSFVLSIDAWRGHCAKRMSQAAHRRLQRLSSSSS